MHQTRVLPWVRASRVGDDGVQLVCQARCWLKQLIPARLNGFSSGEGTMDTSTPFHRASPSHGEAAWSYG